jgi:glycosyltransferase involved in cell wall biosynthesis
LLAKIGTSFVEGAKLVSVIKKNELLDHTWYQTLYPKLNGSYLSCIYHYVFQNCFKLSSPNPFFDCDWYVAKYPDVKKKNMHPVLHYVLYGAEEFRDPSPYFNTKWYVENCIESTSYRVNPLTHFMRVGKSNGLPPFDGSKYVNFFPDEIEESGLFDPAWYLDRYADVANASIEPLIHFKKFGIWEGRAPNKLFDPTWYRNTYDELLPPEAVSFIHYMQTGILEHRMPGPSLEPEWYAQKYNIDLNQHSPILHYLQRSSNKGILTQDPNNNYKKYIAKQQQKNTLNSKENIEYIEYMIIKPVFKIFIDGSVGKCDTLNSLERQLYKNYELIDQSSYKYMPHDYLIWLKSGDVLDEVALFEFAAIINGNSEAEIIYTDVDRFTAGERTEPYFKPDWSPDTLESFNYVGHSACFKLSAKTPSWKESSCIYDFILKYSEFAKCIIHIRKVLFHVQHHVLDDASATQIELESSALSNRLLRTGRSGTVIKPSTNKARYSIQLDIQELPLVSIVIPTAGKVAHFGNRKIDFILNIVENIVCNSSYQNFEIIVVDNGDIDEERIAKLKNWNCKIATYTESKLNIPKKLNIGAKLATGKYLLLINDDIEPLQIDWIERMADHLEKPHVGVVGARLLFPDGTIQHAGIVSNVGFLDHVRKGYPGDEDGVFFSTSSSRNYRAVTGACMMTRTESYRSVGGYTEDLPISFNDVDFCLKLAELGFSAVYAAEAIVTHFESQSRVPELDLDELRYIQARWGKILTSDNFYNEAQYEICPPTFELNQG